MPPTGLFVAPLRWRDLWWYVPMMAAMSLVASVVIVLEAVAWVIRFARGVR